MAAAKNHVFTALQNTYCAKSVSKIMKKKNNIKTSIVIAVAKRTMDSNGLN